MKGQQKNFASQKNKNESVVIKKSECENHYAYLKPNLSIIYILYTNVFRLTNLLNLHP